MSPRPPLPDDLSALLSQLTLTPLSSPVAPSGASSSPGNDSVPQDDMTTQQRLLKLQEMRTSLQQRLLLFLVKVPHVDSETRKDVESQVEELRDLLAGMDLLIQRLSLRNRGEDGGAREGNGNGNSIEEWRGSYEA